MAASLALYGGDRCMCTAPVITVGYPFLWDATVQSDSYISVHKKRTGFFEYENILILTT